MRPGPEPYYLDELEALPTLATTEDRGHRLMLKIETREMRVWLRDDGRCKIEFAVRYDAGASNECYWQILANYRAKLSWQERAKREGVKDFFKLPKPKK